MMALDTLLCYKMSCRSLGCNSRVAQAAPKMARIDSLSNSSLSRTGQTSPARNGLNKVRIDVQLKDQQSHLWHSLGSAESSEDRPRPLEAYYDKANSGDDQPDDSSSQPKSIDGLKSLDMYLGSLGKGKMNNKSQSASPTISPDLSEDSFNEGIRGSGTRTFVGSRRRRNDNLPNGSKVSPTNDESSDLYLVSVLSSIDIAVFLFEVASPIKNSNYNLYSLPLMYGAKVNDLILVGEWWRLVTPMFLHTGVVHVALSCWVLLDFGPRVCKVYGSFTFFFVCLLGGISGNLTSFLHTPEPTVGGSGPIFSIIGAWFIYQIQNKDMIPKEVADKMFQKAAIATTLCFGLANFGLIDSWTYLGAALTGITYGFLTCPILQLDEPLSKATREEGIALVGQYANPCKSLGVFVLFVITFSSLLYLIDIPLETPLLEELLETIE